ncbi:glycosyl hydrolase [Reichenbachiella carrageenanivorans]|uniref:Glycosyl hydrolase n=1 Tax=Reichenbachiella carrageenanivorans TaxID=2979869 RepID=A0ABY6CVC2_9BACT|nr:glycosyl hydrolase [Reichenbachiella carrageenanivorans]UXX77849.1 glycosyl hydrolase [Reichenbachiella carrageenanivorans]
MNNLSRYIALALLIGLSSCISDSSSHGLSEEALEQLPQEVYKRNAIMNRSHLSAASIRALSNNYSEASTWYLEFRLHDLKGDLAFEPGVVRRDPSDIITVKDTMYVYYTKSLGKSHGFGTGDPSNKVFPWDKSDIWMAMSVDGWNWEELGAVIKRGNEGSFDDRSVFTPQILVHENRYILVYQTVRSPYSNRVKNQVAMAWSDHPRGPFNKLTEPILSPADDGVWDGNEDNRYNVKVQGSFDSHKVHDPTLVPYQGKYYLYYKGERMGEKLTNAGREIRWGVAIADQLEGPYTKSPYNPITNSGHQLCVWPYQGGIAGLLVSDGPEKNTIQWAPDGINFHIKSYLKWGPEAVGLDQTTDFEHSGVAALRWGVCHQVTMPDQQYIRRFEGFKPMIP